MKHKNCFIDEKGVYLATSLIESAKGLPVFEFDITTIDLDTVLKWKISTLRDYVVHYIRVTKVDSDRPLIFNSKGILMDGWHRLVKALSQGKKILMAVKFEVDPEPDFKS